MRGFEYLLYRAFSTCLLVVLILLPLAPLFASEIVPDENSTEVSSTSDTSSDAEEIVETESSLPQPEVVSDEPEYVSDEVVSVVDPVIPIPEDVTVDLHSPEDVVDQGVVESEVVSDSSSTYQESESIVTITESLPQESETVSQSENSTEEPFEDVLTPEETIVIEDESMQIPVDEVIDVIENNSDIISLPQSEQPLATSSQGETVSANSVTTDENRFSFAKGECTLVSEDTFYCAKATVTPEVTHTDRVFAAVDAEGDKEIYIEKEGEISVITKNSFDDEAPFYDSSSETIVWHRLIDGRYQIIAYDLDSEEETQITHDRYNNMHPSSYDGEIVWQGWVGDDWEIFLLEGDELTMITDNATHDITPSVNGTHIIWQSFETGVWQMKVYDISTKNIQTIEDTDGGSIQNPRFVLVYDTKFESGDIETRGYDLVSGKVVPLSATPASVPTEIPDPDQTGEKSALVSPQTQLKTKVEDIDDPESSGDDVEAVSDITVTDIVLPLYVSTTTDSESTEGAPLVTDFVSDDLIILPTVPPSASSTEHIDDLIITPYTEPIESAEDIVVE